jgi:hypothetical protein
VRKYLLLALAGLLVSGCAASKVDAPPIIASPMPLAPVAREDNGAPVKPVDGSTCVTYNASAVCARWVRDGQGNLSLEIMRVQR